VTVTTPPVRVLLSTYNGERYLQAQLDSLVAQDYPNMSIVIRDDGSTDRTLGLLEAFAAQQPNTHLYIGDNLGAAGSFLHLLACPAPPGAFFAFCDQDDVWLPGKVGRAVDVLCRQSRPDLTLYFSRLEYVDSVLNRIGTSPPPRHLDFANAVVENHMAGCTQVFGFGVRKRMLEADPGEVAMHDWWAYLVATAFGSVVFDPTPSILYRQHDANVSQWERSSFTRARRRAEEFLRRWQSSRPGFRSLNQAAAFHDTYGAALPEEKAALIRRLIALRPSNGGTFVRRLHYALSCEVHRNRRLDDLVMRSLIVLGQH
jgi:glycosyltransferase involved in cell wall biosynthesis